MNFLKLISPIYCHQVMLKCHLKTSSIPSENKFKKLFSSQELSAWKSFVWFSYELKQLPVAKKTLRKNYRITLDNNDYYCFAAVRAQCKYLSRACLCSSTSNIGTHAILDGCLKVTKYQPRFRLLEHHPFS